MSELTRTAVRAAYWGQHGTMHLGAAVAHNVLRRFVLRDTDRVSLAALRSVERRYVELLRTDLANVEAGDYPAGLLFQVPLRTYARALPKLLRDLPRVFARLRRRDYKDLPANVDLGEYPPYYRRTFHWQTDGYLSRHSADIYDVGVEFLFGGAADIMRRQVIPPIVRWLRERDPAIALLDVACGTGRTLAQLRTALPQAELTGLDLSRFYLDVARRAVHGEAHWVQANAELMPFADASFDVATSVYLFHELPRNARRNVLKELVRVTKPGGLVVVADSVQFTDATELACFMERFAEEMHEPFYLDYAKDDLAAGLRAAGLEVIAEQQAYMTKVVTARRVA